MELYEELAGKLQGSFETDFSSHDWFGTPFQVFIAGEETPEALMLSGGFRGDCRAAARAIVRVAGEIEVSKRAYLAPSFDPTGLNGLGYVLEKIGGDKVASMAGIEDVKMIVSGNLLVMFPEEHSSIDELSRRIEERPFLEKYEGFNVIVASGPEEEAPARSMHVENARLLPLDTWSEFTPGHVGEVFSYIKARSPKIYIELGCLHKAGVSVFTSQETSAALNELLELAIIQLEDTSTLPVEKRVVDEETTFHGLLEDSGVYVVWIRAGGEEEKVVDALATAALSIVNSYAFLSI